MAIQTLGEQCRAAKKGLMKTLDIQNSCKKSPADEETIDC